MAVYFRGPAALITDRWYEAYRPFHQRIAIAHITYAFCVERGRVSPAPMLVGSSSTGVVLAVATWFGWLNVNPPLWAGTALLMAIAASLTARACLGDQGMVFQLWAVVFGVHVLLLETSDRDEFAQVRRGLVRALEGKSHR